MSKISLKRAPRWTAFHACTGLRSRAGECWHPPQVIARSQGHAVVPAPRWRPKFSGQRMWPGRVLPYTLHASMYRCRVARQGKHGPWLSIACVIALPPVKVTNGVFVICVMFYGPVGYDKVRKVTKISNFPWLTPRKWALLEKPPAVQLFKNFPSFYGPRKFITVFTRALH
jgi:hypothetical protein